MLEAASEIGIDPVICHCLQIRESQIRGCAAVLGLCSVRAVKQECGAGAGCTACHRRIRELLRTPEIVEEIALSC